MLNGNSWRTTAAARAANSVWWTGGRYTRTSICRCRVQNGLRERAPSSKSPPPSLRDRVRAVEQWLERCATQGVSWCCRWALRQRRQYRSLLFAPVATVIMSAPRRVNRRGGQAVAHDEREARADLREDRRQRLYGCLRWDGLRRTREAAGQSGRTHATSFLKANPISCRSVAAFVVCVQVVSDTEHWRRWRQRNYWWTHCSIIKGSSAPSLLHTAAFLTNIHLRLHSHYTCQHFNSSV